MATSKPWIYAQNTFLNVTSESYRLAVRISTYHLGALQSQAGEKFFDDLIEAFEPLHEALITSYDNWKSTSGTQQGKTLNINQLLSLLSGSKIRSWDISIQNVYAIDTPEYKSLLPNRRTPFQTGTQTDRLSAIDALSQAIGADAALATVKTDVDAFYTLLSTALNQQKGSIASTKSKSDTLEAARVAMCIAQYSDLGALMQKYATTPENISQYFDLIAIRSGSQVIFTGDTKALQHENVLKHTFSATDTVRLENEGPTDLQFYLSAAKDDGPGATTVTVAAGQEVSALITQLGSVANTFLNVYNTSAIAKGEWTIELE